MWIHNESVCQSSSVKVACTLLEGKEKEYVMRVCVWREIKKGIIMKKVAIIGIQGVPAKYGGFESLVENIIGGNCSAEVLYTVFCSGMDMKERLVSYKGCELKYVTLLSANGAQSVVYDIVSMCGALRGYDVLLVLGVSGCLFLPIVKLFSKSKVVVNIDGLEHRRKKWGSVARCFLRLSEWMAVRWADVVVADNKGIEEYVVERYGKKPELIAYGGDHVMREVGVEREVEILSEYGVEKGKYAVSICRIEPENNCHIILEAFARCGRKLVFVGNWRKSHYGFALREKYRECKNIIFVDALYDLDVLYVLRKNAGWYMHGHSAGGTNPSLVEAMFFGRPIIAYDVVYNRETTMGRAVYFKSVSDICRLLNEEIDGSELRCIAERQYTWERIARQYESLY